MTDFGAFHYSEMSLMFIYMRKRQTRITGMGQRFKL
jgi:hypothetical protein